MMQKNNPVDSNNDRKGSSPAKLPISNPATQLKATAAAKEAQINEAGLGGNRTGKASASVKRAQARRDSHQEITPEILPTPEPAVDIETPQENPLLVQVNTDHNVHGSESLHHHIQSTVEAALSRFGHRLTRVEVHISDDNGSRTRGDDKRCLMEARPAGLQPVVVSQVSATVYEAVDGAVEKMEKLLDSTFAKLHHPKGRTSLGEEPAPPLEE